MRKREEIVGALYEAGGGLADLGSVEFWSLSLVLSRQKHSLESVYSVSGI